MSHGEAETSFREILLLTDLTASDVINLSLRILEVTFSDSRIL